MRIHPSLKSWVGIVSRKMPHFSKPQAKVLAMWSFGIAITQSSGLTTVSVFLAKLLGIKENTVRQRLREWLRDAKDKTGKNRTAIDVTSCFAPILSWILTQWQPGETKLALAIDATTLGQRFTVLAISILSRGSAIPVAHENCQSDVTDLDPQLANSSWYAMRSWIECSFKDTKRGGFLWHQTKTTDPVRAERHWLAIAIAMLWLVSVGGEDETANRHTNQLNDLEQTACSESFSSPSQSRLLSCFRRGFLSILVALLWGQPLPIGHFYSFPWTNSLILSSA